MHKMSLKQEERESLRQSLKKVPVFRNISVKYLEQFIDDFTITHTQKDEFVLFQTDRSTDLYIILKGKVKVTLISEEGEEFVLSDLHEGDFFGEMSLIDGNPRSASVIAEEDSTFGVLNREKLLNAIKHDPMIAIDLLKSLVYRLRQATEREEHFAFLDIRERLLKLFGTFIKTEGEREENGFYRIKKRTHKDLAVRIGASREAISKVLKALSSKQIVIEKKGFFLISPSVYEESEKVHKTQ